MDNVIPFIPGEEGKLEPEARKILGSMVTADKNSAVEEQASLRIDATCSRVGVSDGHMVYVSLRFEKRPPPGVEQVKRALQGYLSEVQQLGCVSAPRQAIVVSDESDRPQPRLDRDLEDGRAVSVGRIRPGRQDGHFDLRFVALSQNTVLGSAGSSIVNVEAAIRKGFL
jgi:aspartate-semialdehyde dehydrogenase